MQGFLKEKPKLLTPVESENPLPTPLTPNTLKPESSNAKILSLLHSHFSVQ